MEILADILILAAWLAVMGGIPIYLILLVFKYLRLKIKLLEKRVENEHLYRNKKCSTRV